MATTTNAVLDEWATSTTNADVLAELWPQTSDAVRVTDCVRAPVNRRVITTARKAGVDQLVTLVPHVADPDVLDELSRHRSPKVIAAVIANPATPQVAIARLAARYFKADSPPHEVMCQLIPHFSSQQLVTLYDRPAHRVRFGERMLDAFVHQVCASVETAEDLAYIAVCGLGLASGVYSDRQSLVRKFLDQVANNGTPSVTAAAWVAALIRQPLPDVLDHYCLLDEASRPGAAWSLNLLAAAKRVTVELRDLVRTYLPLAAVSSPGFPPQIAPSAMSRALSADYAVIVDELRHPSNATFRYLASWIAAQPDPVAQRLITMLREELDNPAHAAQEYQYLVFVAAKLLSLSRAANHELLSRDECVELVAPVIHLAHQVMTTTPPDSLAGGSSVDRSVLTAAIDAVLFGDSRPTTTMSEQLLFEALVALGLDRAARIEQWVFGYRPTRPSSSGENIPETELVRAVLAEVAAHDQRGAMHFAFAVGSSHWPAPDVVERNPRVAQNLDAVLDVLRMSDILSSAAASVTVARRLASRLDDACAGTPGMVASVRSLLNEEWGLSFPELIETARMLAAPAAPDALVEGERNT